MRHDWDSDTVAAPADAVESLVDQGTAYLVVVRGDDIGRAFTVVGPELVIGRGSEAELRLNNDGISRVHCKLIQDAGSFVVEDLASRNGTLHNGQRVVGRSAALKEGDSVQVGTSVVLRFTHVHVDAAEHAIAKHIQTGTLPRYERIAGLEIAASMQPVEDVAGDYYDVIPVHDGCWLAIGDVSGHGMRAGMITVMIQSAVGTLVRSQPDAAPSVLLAALNELLYDNIRQRLRNDEHVTFTLLRYTADGRIRFAGAHEDLLIWRAATGTFERIPTPGTWLGISRKIDHALVDSVIALSAGDVLVLYTDGAIEATNRAREQFGLERFEAVVEQCRDRPASEMVKSLGAALAAWTPKRDDDITVVVLRYGDPVQ